MTAFDPTLFLVVHGINFLAWSTRWGVTPFERPCYACGRTLCATEPIAQGNLRGLRAPRCECGDEHPPYRIVRADGDDLFTGKAKS